MDRVMNIAMWKNNGTIIKGQDEGDNVDGMRHDYDDDEADVTEVSSCFHWCNGWLLNSIVLYCIDV
jgi:hypothetical protein